MQAEDQQVVSINERMYWSLSQLSKAFSVSRETATKRLVIAGVEADRKRGGFDVYHIAKAAKAILDGDSFRRELIEDPDTLKPKERLDWYRGETEKSKHLREAGELIPVSEVTKEMAGVVKACVRTLDTLPDLLEMKCDLSPESIQLIERECDNVRTQLAAELTGDELE